MKNFKNDEAKNRYIHLVSRLQKTVMEYPELRIIVSGDDDPFKDAICYLFIPECMNIPKPLMHTLYSLTFASDETILATTAAPRFVYILREVFTEGITIPDPENIDDMFDEALGD